MEAGRETTNREITGQVCCGALAGAQVDIGRKVWAAVLLESITRPLQAYLGHRIRYTAVTRWRFWNFWREEAFARSVCSTKSAEWSKNRPHSPSAGESTGIVEATEPDRLPPFR
jgi:hypothetical protein